MNPMHEAIKKRMAHHEHGGKIGHQGNDAPMPPHGSGPEHAPEMLANAGREALQSDPDDMTQQPVTAASGANGMHGMGDVKEEAEPGDESGDAAAYDRMYPNHGNEVPTEHGRTLASKMQHHVAKNILYRGVESAARPRAHMGAHSIKK